MRRIAEVTSRTTQAAEQLRATRTLAFYMKAETKDAEHHGLQARIASWRGDPSPPGGKPPEIRNWHWPDPEPRPPSRRKNFRDAVEKETTLSH